MKSVSENGAVGLLGFHVGCSFQTVQSQDQNQDQFHVRAAVKNGWSISGPRLMTVKSSHDSSSVSSALSLSRCVCVTRLCAGILVRTWTGTR